MADGIGCVCCAYNESECDCGVDWTPQEIYDLRAAVAKCRDLLKQYPCATDGMNSSNCKACDIIAECDKVLGEKL